MTAPDDRGDRNIIRLGSYQVKLGLRTLVALVLAGAIVWMGFVVSPENPTAGVVTGVSGVLGAVLGVLVDVRPVPFSYRAEAVGAVRKLHSTTQSVEDIQTALNQVSEFSKNLRVNVGIANAQADLERIRNDLFESMGEWEQVSPGAAEAVRQVRSAGSDMLRQMTDQQEENP